jgi:AraC-like DNA-binding protein
MDPDWIGLLELLTLIQLLLLTAVILNYKKGKRLSNLLLAGFMASNALLIAHSLAVHAGWTSSGHRIGLYSIGSSLYFLLMPFLYLYIQSLCYETFRLRAVHLIHIIPFILFAAFTAAATSFSTLGSTEYWSHHIALNVQILSYLLASFFILIGYRTRLRELYSSIERIDLSWCNLLLSGVTAMWLLDLLNWILGIYNMSSPAVSYGMFTASMFINLTFTLIVTYKGLAQSVSFSGIQGPPKYAASRLKPSDCEDIVRKLTACMENEKSYLAPSLSVEDLSRKLNIPARNLSQALHSGLNKNFYDFVNSYRIDEIKKRIQDAQYQNLTLFAIALEAGFNSKSVFNEAFKKHSGITPKAYKRRHSSG